MAIVTVVRFRIRDGNEADLQADKLLDNEPINPDDTKKFGIKQKDGSILWMATAGAGANSAFLLAHPVGAIYITVDSTNPGTSQGGTWVLWGAGRVPVCVDTAQTEFNSVEKTGGEKTHKLSVSEMPAHTHSVMNGPNGLAVSSGIGADDSNYAFTDNPCTSRSPFSAASTGDDAEHNNLPPYITCYMWKRTA